MRARFRSWWKIIKQHRVSILVVTIILVVAITLIILGYRFDWTGFNGNNKSGKTLWDWLQLLIIPLALAIIALVFQLANTRTERQIAKERYEQDQQIALDKQHEDLLQAYLDRMSELLLKEQLRSSEDDAEVRNVARVRTITVLTQLDARRIGYVFSFLREAGLMSTTSNDNVVSLSEADLHAVNWSQADLRFANLSGANLGGANLGGANLSKANFSEANLSRANFSEANLSEAFLGRANLSGAFLSRANLSEARLSGANLRYAHLMQADLSEADLSGADLSGADLSHADLSEADLSHAILEGTNFNKAWVTFNKAVTKEQLETAKSLKGATMPDGSIHP